MMTFARSWPVAAAVLLSSSLAPVPAAAAEKVPPEAYFERSPLPGTPEIDDEVVTTWRAVTWDDFKARWRKLSRFGAEGGYIATGFEITDWTTHPERKGDGAWRARPEGLLAHASMEKLRSSHQPGADSAYNLAHEQGHFDLTEVVTRRLWARLLTLEGRGPTPGAAAQDLRDRVEAAFRDATEEHDRIQLRYDRETTHGTKKRAQRKWLRQIPQLLEEAAGRVREARGGHSDGPRSEGAP